jgi:hypothetical protein
MGNYKIINSAQCSCIVIESSFDPGERLQAPGSLWFNVFLTQNNELQFNVIITGPMLN